MPPEDRAAHILVVDDGSSDSLPPGSLTDVRVVRLPTHRGFAAAVNEGVKAATTTFVAILHSDVEVQPGWLSSVSETLYRDPSAVVSSLILQADLTVEQLGLCVFNQGTLVPFGAGVPVTDPEVASQMAPHAVSFIAVVLARALFLDAGGLDESFSLGSYRDSDFSLRIRYRGSRLLIEPESRVIHLGGQDYGGDGLAADEALAYERHTFFTRWASRLDRHPYPHAYLSRPSLNPGRPHILFVAESVAWPDGSVAGSRMQGILEWFLDTEWLVTVIGEKDQEDSPHVLALRRKGVVVYTAAGQLATVPWPRILSSRIEVAWVTARDVFNQVSPIIKLLNPAVTLWYTADPSSRGQEEERHQQSAWAREIVAIEGADHVFVGDESEQHRVSEINPHVSVVGGPHETPPRQPAGDRPGHVMLLGDFADGSDMDAAVHLVERIWPLVHRQAPDATLVIAGDNVPPALVDYHGHSNVRVEHSREAARRLLFECRVAVAPFRSGTDSQSKVNRALAAGVPVVASPQAVGERAGGKAVRLADPDHPSEFAQAILTVYQDEGPWGQLQDRCPTRPRRLYPREQITPALTPALASVRLRLSVSLVMLSWNRQQWTAKAVDSVLAHTADLKELIVVDNASEDGSWEWLRNRAADEPRLVLVRNPTNCGFAGGMNAGLRRAQGDIVGVLNNDVLVPSGWMPRMLARFEDPEVVAVGPVTTRISGTQCVAASYTEEEFDDYAQEWFYTHVGQSGYTPRLVAFVLLLRREALDRLGGFDVRFGRGNFEDDDFSIRLASLGRLAIAYDVLVHHEGSVSFRDVPPEEIRQLYQENQAWLHRKWGPVWDATGHWLPQPVRSYSGEMYCPMVASMERSEILSEALRQRDRGEWGFVWLTLNLGQRDEVSGVAEVLTLLHLNPEQALQVAGQLVQTYTRLEMSIALVLALEANGRRDQATMLRELLARQWPSHPYGQGAEEALWTWIETQRERGGPARAATRSCSPEPTGT